MQLCWLCITSEYILKIYEKTQLDVLRKIHQRHWRNTKFLFCLVTCSGRLGLGRQAYRHVCLLWDAPCLKYDITWMTDSPNFLLDLTCQQHSHWYYILNHSKLINLLWFVFKTSLITRWHVICRRGGHIKHGIQHLYVHKITSQVWLPIGHK